MIAAPRPSLLASFWTLAGDLAVNAPGPSPWPVEERVAAAVEAGYDGVGLDHRDVAAFGAGPGLQRLAAILDGAGVSLVELELLTGWCPAPFGGVAARNAELIRAAGVLGARHVKAGAGFAPADVSTEILTRAFATLCALAADHGTGVVLELLATGPVSTLERAVEIVAGADAPNGGLLLDVWHVQRAGIPFSAVAAIPPGLVTYVELCDGRTQSDVPALEDATTNRMLCGDGELDLAGFVRATSACGYAGPYGVEIVSASLRGCPLRHVARRSASGATAVLAA